MEHYQDYISINPHIRFGKPCITGTRIAVQDVLSWLASGMSFDEIFEDFPELTMEQVRAALAFAAVRRTLAHRAQPACPLKIPCHLQRTLYFWRLC